MAANWAGCCIAKIGKGNIKKKETSKKEVSEGRELETIETRDERRETKAFDWRVSRVSRVATGCVLGRMKRIL